MSRCTSSVRFVYKSLCTWCIGILGSGRDSNDLPTLSLLYFSQRYMRVISDQQQRKSPTKQRLLICRQSCSSCITVFPSAFSTLHPHKLDLRVVKTSAWLLPVENKVCPLNKELQGRWHWSVQPHTTRLQLSHPVPSWLLHLARSPSTAPSGTEFPSYVPPPLLTLWASRASQGLPISCRAAPAIARQSMAPRSQTRLPMLHTAFAPPSPPHKTPNLLFFL